MPNNVSTRGRCGRSNIDTPRAKPTMAAKSSLCVRMSMSKGGSKCTPLLLCALLASPLAAQPASPPPAEVPAEMPAEANSEPALDTGFVRVPNPAFPSPQVHEVPLSRGRRFERADLAPYFADGAKA